MAKVDITVLERGSGGAKPQPGDRVTMDYIGSVAAISGHKISDLIKQDKNYEQYLEPFDQTYTKGVPFSFIVDAGEVIKGWDEAVKKMELNEKSVWIIPYSLGYGEQGAGAGIPPKSDLKFEVKLLHIHKPFKDFTIQNQINDKIINFKYDVNGIGSRFYNRTIIKDRMLGIVCKTNPDTLATEFSLTTIDDNNSNNNKNSNDEKEEKSERIIVEKDLSNNEEKQAWQQIEGKCDQLAGFGFREMLKLDYAMDIKPGYVAKFNIPCKEAFGKPGVRLRSNRKWLVANGQDLEIAATVVSIQNSQN